MVKINGENIDAAGLTISAFLDKSDYGTSRIAVERNGEIVPKALYATTVLEDGDELEIVQFVGGG